MKFEDLHIEMAKTYPRLFPKGPLYWGFEHGPGWGPLIRTLCADINTLISDYPDVEIAVVQVKEKFGALRFYCQLAENCPEDLRLKIRALIDAASAESLKTCETCAKPSGLDKSRAYIVTRCPECRAKAEQA